MPREGEPATVAPATGAPGPTAPSSGDPEGPWCPENAVVSSWKARKSILNAARLQFWRDLPGANLRDSNGEARSFGAAYLCLTQIRKMGRTCDKLESFPAQPVWGVPFVPKVADWASQDETTAEDSGPRVTVPHRQIGGEGPRWRGRLNPSLFMTAVAVGRPQPGRREHAEGCGRDHRRVMRMTAEERARNDLPPPAPLLDALQDPSEWLRARMIESALDRMAGGPRADRLAAVDRLVSLGVLPAIPADPRDPMRRTVDAAVRQQGGARGLAPFLRELKATLPDGLGPCAKSAHPPQTHGFNGLTAAGRRSIRDACSLLRERMGALVFGTVTLPDREAEECSRDQLATFQSRWLFYARRMLIRRGLDPLVVLVAEIHPKRKTMAGGPIIHWHYCAPTSTGPYRAWSVTKEDWHTINRQAFRSAFGRERTHNHGCRVEGAESDPGRYLSKYMSKGRSDCRALIGTEWERCIPRQWWAWTGEIRRKVVACRSKPPSAFLAWCVRWRADLEVLGQITSGQVTIGEDGPTIGWWFGWQSAEALDRAIRQWMEDEMATIDAREGAGPDDPPRGPDPMQWWEADAAGALGAG